jgi:hypothetical protein
MHRLLKSKIKQMFKYFLYIDTKYNSKGYKYQSRCRFLQRYAVELCFPGKMENGKMEMKTDLLTERKIRNVKAANEETS